MGIARLLLLVIFLGQSLHAEPWISDLGNGRYKNPVLFADYSDPDLVKVGDDFYMVASSFNAMPGIPVLHSRDLINWQIIGHVYERLPFEKYDRPAHGQGAWAPSIRYHNGIFYVYFCTPDRGLFVATTKNPAGAWTLKHMVDVELWEDPAPFWDEDGKAYLVRGKVRADILYLHRMSADGLHLLDDGKIIYHDLQENPVIEGPKMFKKDGWYYIMAPAGGVENGWQTALRSRNPYGPYEAKKILQQGNTAINGPHQGGLVQLDSGQWWFMHFQDRGVYGRVAHLQPVNWINGWPIPGETKSNKNLGEPIIEFAKPAVKETGVLQTPQTSDEFESPDLGLQWQWHANPKKKWYSLSDGKLRLSAIQNLTQNGNLWFSPNLLLQKFPAPEFIATTKLRFNPAAEKDKAGLVIMGQEWAYLAMYRSESNIRLGMFTGHYDPNSDATKEIESKFISKSNTKPKLIYLQARIADGGLCQFYFSSDGKKFRSIGKPFQAKKGLWIGAKVGVFSQNPSITKSEGYGEFDWFRVE